MVYKRTKELLIEHREGLEKVAAKLLEKEVLFQSDLEDLLGKRPFEHRTAYDKFVNGSEPDTILPGLVDEVSPGNTGAIDSNADEIAGAATE